MPISSGALGWPVRHFREDVKDATDISQIGKGNEIDDANDHIWRVQLADRDEYDRWKDEYDKMKDLARDEATIVLQRYRRRRCLLLSLCLLVLFSAIFYGLVFLYTHYLDEDNLEPVVTFQNTECGGIWRKHFLIYSNTLKNGTRIFFCCFMPDINRTAKNWVLSQGDAYPSGYMIRQTDCNPSGQKCEDFETAGTFDPGTPPCSGAAHATTPAVDDITTLTAGSLLIYCVFVTMVVMLSETIST